MIGTRQYVLAHLELALKALQDERTQFSEPFRPYLVDCTKTLMREVERTVINTPDTPSKEMSTRT